MQCQRDLTCTITSGSGRPFTLPSKDMVFSALVVVGWVMGAVVRLAAE